MLPLLIDYYEMTSGRVNFDSGANGVITENYFIRKAPEHMGSYFVVAGLEQVISYITNFRIRGSALSWIEENAGQQLGSKFIKYLSNFRFRGSVHAMPEGSIAFPNEPIINITGPSIDVQLFETYLLNLMNFQTKVATKASRVVNAAEGRPIIEFGARRADGRDAALLGVRAAYIAGVDATSLLLASKMLGIPFSGTMPHKFVQERVSEIGAFREYAKIFPDNAVLLIDTYNTESGARLASLVGRELAAKGHTLAGVRIDSGDLLTLSKKVRKILDLNGLTKTKIIASGDLDEYQIAFLLRKGAPIDNFGVGTRLITGSNYDSIKRVGGISALGGVYKLVEVERSGYMAKTIKISDDPEKTTLPGAKQVYRHVRHGRFVGDTISLWNEKAPSHSIAMLKPIIINGKFVKKLPPLKEIRDYYAKQIAMLGNEYKQIRKAKRYPVSISPLLMKSIKELKASLERQILI